jgi:hypothetical protein
LIDGDNGDEIEIKAIYVSHSDEWDSPIAIPDLENWARTYGHDIVGITSNNGDGSYAG